jgi:hypothetical protein
MAHDQTLEKRVASGWIAVAEAKMTFPPARAGSLAERERRQQLSSVPGRSLPRELFGPSSLPAGNKTMSDSMYLCGLFGPIEEPSWR